MSLEHAPQRQGTAFLTANQVRQRYGSISDMTLWRWINDPALRFPKPTFINRRRYFAVGRLDEFDARQSDTHGQVA